MAASGLTLAEQKKSLSAKKKKKKVLKNVLGPPKSVKVETVVIDGDESEKLCAILSRLLPCARIPIKKKHNEDKPDEKAQENLDNSKLVAAARMKRKGLALGVNEVNTGVKKNSISAALLASDIQPRFLVHHLNLLCKHNNVPFLHVPELRIIIEKALGFPSIALGFKKDFEDFREAVSEVKAIFNSKSIGSKPNLLESDSEGSESGESENEKGVHKGEQVGTSNSGGEKPFTYLYRTSKNERVFIPGNDSNGAVLGTEENEFISLGKDTEDDMIEDKSTCTPKLISSCHTKKKIPGKKGNKSINDEKSVSDDEDYEVPKKKQKMGWTIDKVGEKRNWKYSPANTVRCPSNENRKKKKNK